MVEFQISNQETHTGIIHMPMVLTGEQYSETIHAMESLQKKGITSIILDFQETEYLDTDFIYGLYKILIHALENQIKTMALLENESIHYLLKSANIDQFLQIYSNLEELTFYQEREHK